MRIAFIRRDGLGDLVNSLPTLLYLKEKFPNSQITLFLSRKNVSLVPYIPPFGEVVVLPHRGNKYIKLALVALKYRKKKYDLAISGKTSPMKLINFFLWVLGAKKKIAYVNSSFSSRWVNHPIRYDALWANTTHQALKGIKMVAPEVEHISQHLLPKLHVQAPPLPGGFKVLLSATTTKEASRLDPKTYATLVNQVSAKVELEVILVGEKKDAKRVDEIAKHLTVPYKVHFPVTFDAFMVLQKQCDFFFVGDGGVAHITSALGKRGVVLFGGASDKQWAPLSDKVISLYHPNNVNQMDFEKVLNSLLKGVQDGREASCRCV